MTADGCLCRAAFLHRRGLACICGRRWEWRLAESPGVARVEVSGAFTADQLETLAVEIQAAASAARLAARGLR